MDHINLNRSQLIQHSLKEEDTFLSQDGALCSYTGEITGRSAKDKYIVLDAQTENTVDWSTNVAMHTDNFDKLYGRVLAYLQGKDTYTNYLSAGHDIKLNFELKTTSARAAVFGTNMFYEVPQMKSQFKVIHVPDFKTDPEVDGIKSNVCIAINFTKMIVIIAGTSYLGEIKKSIFTCLNFILPQLGVLPMHASVNESMDHNNSCVFFGLSGTGKTSLSSNLDRILIGDDEHGWNEHGLFNFENGCYAKTINLSKEAEPQIYNAVNKFGSVLENVDVIDNKLEFNSNKFSENGRASYRLSDIENASETRRTNHPKNIVMLTYDIFGVLPPVSKLTHEQAHYYFLNGYTGRMTGTEVGATEPTAIFSFAFGAPFFPLKPKVYADLFLNKIKQHNCNVFLVNTGLQGGGYGVGERISIANTRKIINSILADFFNDQCAFYDDNLFNLQIPEMSSLCDGLDLDPEFNWDNKDEYEKACYSLIDKFDKNHLKYEA